MPRTHTAIFLNGDSSSTMKQESLAGRTCQTILAHNQNFNPTRVFITLLSYGVVLRSEYQFYCLWFVSSALLISTLIFTQQMRSYNYWYIVITLPSFYLSS